MRQFIILHFLPVTFCIRWHLYSPFQFSAAHLQSVVALMTSCSRHAGTAHAPPWGGTCPSLVLSGIAFNEAYAAYFNDMRSRDNSPLIDPKRTRYYNLYSVIYVDIPLDILLGAIYWIGNSITLAYCFPFFGPADQWLESLRFLHVLFGNWLCCFLCVVH